MNRPAAPSRFSRLVVRRFAPAALAFSCSPTLLDDCSTSADCAEGICEEGYCVPRADAAGSGGGGGETQDAHVSVGTLPDASGPGGSTPDAATPTPDAAPPVPDAAPPVPDVAPPEPDAAPPEPDAGGPDGSIPDAGGPDGSTPDAFVEPPPAIVGECQNDRSEFPLYALTGEPCVVLDATAVWSFEGNYAARGGGGRAFNANVVDDDLAPGALTYVDSPFDQAASFFGSDDRWQGASVRSSVRNVGPMTIEAWIWLPTTSEGGAVISNIDDCNWERVSAGWQLGIQRQDDPLGFLVTLDTWDGADANFGGSVRNVFQEGIVLAPEQWHHVAVVFEGEGGVPSRVWAWADGFELGVASDVHFGDLNDAAWVHLGTRANCVVQALEMQLDAVRVMSRALTLEELDATNGL